MESRGKQPAFFFDFDGTLVNIAATPGDVRLKMITRQILEGIAEEYPVGVISGRKLDELKRLVGIRGLYYSGNHGVEIEGAGLDFVEPVSARSSAYITSLGKSMASALSKFSPRINSKKYSVSVHYRNVEKSLVRGLLRRVDELLEEPLLKRQIEVFHGKKVVEIKAPVDWDKGKAIELICRKIGRNSVPVFFGDDTTDEYGFRAVNKIGGVSVFVGKRHRQTDAGFWVKSPSELAGELAKFLFEA